MKPHHGEIGSLNSEDCTKLLERGRLGHLACHVKDDIYVVPITYVFEDGFIYSHSKLGKKIEMMRKNPQVCIQVEEVDLAALLEAAIIYRVNVHRWTGRYEGSST